MARKNKLDMQKPPSAAELQKMLLEKSQQLAACIKHNQDWQKYARQLEALHNEKVEIIDRLQAELDALRGTEIVQ